MGHYPSFTGTHLVRLDQGAGQALKIYRVASRYISGLVEEALKAYVNDKTDWRKMLKFEAEAQDLAS